MTNLRKQTLLLANLPQEEEDKNIIVPLRVGRYSEENVTSGFEMHFKELGHNFPYTDLPTNQ